MLPKSSYN